MAASLHWEAPATTSTYETALGTGSGTIFRLHSPHTLSRGGSSIPEYEEKYFLPFQKLGRMGQQPPLVRSQQHVSTLFFRLQH